MSAVVSLVIVYGADWCEDTARAPALQENYIACWAGLKKHFDPGRKEPT